MKQEDGSQFEDIKRHDQAPEELNPAVQDTNTVDTAQSDSLIVSKKASVYIIAGMGVVIATLVGVYFISGEGPKAEVQEVQSETPTLVTQWSTEGDVWGIRNQALAKDFYELPERVAGGPGSSPVYYISFIGFSSVKVIDQEGRTADYYMNGYGRGIPGISFDLMGEESVMVSATAGKAYTYRASLGTYPAGLVDIVYGYNNGEGSLMAIRYLDVVLPPGSVVEFQTSSKGITALRYDQNGNGEFTTGIAPTALVYGQDAVDSEGPRVSITGRDQGESFLITISASDPAGVHKIYYSTNNQKFELYDKPFTVDKSVSAVQAFAEDKAGNRGAPTDYSVR